MLLSFCETDDHVEHYSRKWSVALSSEMSHVHKTTHRRKVNLSEGLKHWWSPIQIPFRCFFFALRGKECTAHDQVCRWHAQGYELKKQRTYIEDLHFTLTEQKWGVIITKALNWLRQTCLLQPSVTRWRKKPPTHINTHTHTRARAPQEFLEIEPLEEIGVFARVTSRHHKKNDQIVLLCIYF